MGDAPPGPGVIRTETGDLEHATFHGQFSTTSDVELETFQMLQPEALLNTAGMHAILRASIEPGSDRWIVIGSIEQLGNTASIAVKDEGEGASEGTRVWSIQFRGEGTSVPAETQIAVPLNEDGWGTWAFSIQQYQNGDTDRVTLRAWQGPIDPELGMALGQSRGVAMDSRAWTPLFSFPGVWDGIFYAGAGPLETWGGPNGDAIVAVWSITEDLLDHGATIAAAIMGAEIIATVDPFDFEEDGPEPEPTPETTAVPAPAPVTVPPPSTPPAPTPGEEVDAGSNFLANVLETLFGGLVDSVTGLFNWLGGHLTSLVGWIIDSLWSAMQWLAQVMQSIWASADGLLRFLAKAIANTIEWVGRLIQDLGDMLWGLLTSIGTAIWEAIDWLYSGLVNLFGYLVENIGIALGWVTDALGSIITSAANGILSGLQEILSALFVPESMTIDVSVPTFFAQVDAEFGEVAAALPTGDGGSICGPVVSDTVAGSEVWFAFPSWSSGCPGNGPGHSRTSVDEAAGTLGGWRVFLRIVFGVAVFAAILWRFYGYLPWVDQHDYEANPVQMSLDL